MNNKYKYVNSIIWALVLLAVALFVPLRVELNIKEKQPSNTHETDTIKGI